MASRQKKPEYKPLLFSTTVRNPSRMKDALKIMSKFEGKTLTNKLAKDIFKEVIKKKKYSPRKAWNNPLTRHLKEKYYSEESLTNSELDLIIDNIIQIISKEILSMVGLHDFIHFLICIDSLVFFIMQDQALMMN